MKPLFLIFLLFLAGCTGIAQRPNAGDALFLYQKDRMEKQLFRVAERVKIAAAPLLNGRKITVSLIHDRNINAWSSKDGAIAVSDAMMMAILNDDELAMICGHEIAHVIHGDDPTWERGVIVASGVLLGSIGEFAAKSAISPASRKRETAADDLGLRLAAAAGFDERKAQVIFARIYSPGDHVSWLSDHPAYPERMIALRAVEQDIKRRRDAGLPLFDVTKNG